MGQRLHREGGVAAYPSNWRGRCALDDYLQEHGIVGIQGIDTRALTRHLRDHGAQEGIISTEELDADRLVARARALPGLVGRDLVSEVTVDRPHGWNEGAWESRARLRQPPRPGSASSPTTPASSSNILRQLASLGLRRHGGARAARRPRTVLEHASPTASSSPTGRAIPEAVAYLVESVRGAPRQGADLRHLPRAPDPRARPRRQDLQAQVRPPRRQPSGAATSRPGGWRSPSQNHGFAVDPTSRREARAGARRTST